MELLVAFSTDDGKNLIDDHAGMAKHFYIYRFCEGKQELVEIRENVKFKGDESEKHGDPRKARATSSVLRWYTKAKQGKWLLMGGAVLPRPGYFKTPLHSLLIYLLQPGKVPS